MVVHWAKSLKDTEQTGCREVIGKVLARADDAIAFLGYESPVLVRQETEKFRSDSDACPNCLAALA